MAALRPLALAVLAVAAPLRAQTVSGSAAESGLSARATIAPAPSGLSSPVALRTSSSLPLQLSAASIVPEARIAPVAFVPVALAPLAPQKGQTASAPFIAVPIDFTTLRPIETAKMKIPAFGEWATVPTLDPGFLFDGAGRKKPGAREVSGADDERLPPPLPPAKKTYGAALRVAAAGSLSVAVLAPVVRGEVPASALLYALAAAWTLAAGLELLYTLYRVGRWAGRRGKRVESETRPVWRRALRATGALVAGLVLGAGLGTAPWKVQSHIVERGAGLIAPELGARSAGTAFAEEAMAGSTIERIKGLKTPAVFVADVSALPVRYEPRLHALLISPKALAARGWTVEEFVNSPVLQRRLARELDADAARELFRMSQAMNNPFYDGQNLDAGPIEAEREALLFEHDYVHAKLKADPHAPLDAAALERYVTMLGDFKRGLARHDSLPEVARRGYWNAGHYRALFLHRDFDWPEHAVEGYLLLARRAATSHERAQWIKRAFDLADREGVSLRAK